MSELTFDVGLASKLKQAMIRNGIGDLADIDWLCKGDNVAQVRRLRQGRVVLTVPEHLIDCDADPYLPDGWKVKEHKKKGVWKWNPAQIKFYLHPEQQGNKGIEGNKLRKALEGKNVLNVNVLDYLLNNSHLIPEEWKKDERGKTRYIFFWGTVYRSSDGYLLVRYLYWSCHRWVWGYDCLNDGWGSDYPAAVLQAS